MEEDIITVLDILDISEDIVDNKLYCIINNNNKYTQTSKQWKTLVILLKYKLLLNQKEQTDCENEDIVQKILNHILKLANINHENFLVLLEAFKVSLLLNEDNLKKLSEHFIQQLLSSPEIVEKTCLYSNIINTILNVCIQSKLYISSRFLLDDMERLMKKSENNPSLLNIVPKIIAVSGEPFVLNRIWDFVVSKPYNNHDYTILCTLSDYYFSSERSKRLNMLSTLTKSLEFWMLIRHGFTDGDVYARKCSIYLAKRAVNTICESKHPIIVNLEDDTENPEPLVHYDPKNRNKFENDWKDLFALLEILEEKQYRLVEPAIQLFSQLKSLHDTWICCALTRALNHDIESIKSMAIEVTLSLSLSWKHFTIETLLNALNNVYIYENIPINTLIESIKKFLARDDNLMRVVKCLKNIPWSPIPKFYIIYSMFSMKGIKLDMKLTELIEYLCSESIKMNNSCIQEAADICLFNFIIKNLSEEVIKPNDLISLMEKFKNIMIRNSPTWKIFLEWIRINQTELITTDNLKNYESFAKYCYCLKETHTITEVDFEKLIDNAFEILKQSTCREYASKEEFIPWFSYIASIIEFIDDNNENIKIKIINNIETIFCFLKHFVSNIEEYPKSDNITNGLKIMIQNQWFCDNTTHIIKNFCDDLISSFLTTKSSNHQKYFCIKFLSILASPADSVISDLIFKKTFFEWDENSNGKINCDYYEALSKLYNNVLNRRSDFNESEIEILYSAVDDFLEIGGYNCIIFAIKLFKIIYPRTFEYKGCEACENIFRLIWKNIFDIRKSDQFKTCIRAFITLLFVINNEIVMKYISELFVLGELSPNVILELVNYVSLNKNKIDDKHVNLILAKAVVFGNILRKDQRVESEVCLFIQRQKLYHIEKSFIPYISTTIRKNAVNCIEQSRTISAEVAKQIKELLQETKIKTRYHDNTTHHRILLRSMQLLLLDQKFNLNKKIDIDLKWYLDLLKNPNPSSVKILIEWFIILQLIGEGAEFKEITKYDIFDLPQISLFTIIYHVVKCQIAKQKLMENNDYIVKKNLIFALTFFSLHTMGSLFSVRLYSQYLMNQLLNLTEDPEICNKYAIMKATLPKILSQMEDEKSMKKIRNDFYINEFDPIRNLTVFDLYYNLPQLYGVSKDEWICFAPDDLDFNGFNLDDPESNERNISIVDNSIVQKKFLPSKPLLGDLQLPVEEISELDKLTESKKLIVVASLIDKLPNLGGLSRTCEVFGVKQYVISSLRHVQDKQFQSVSVSAENWLDIIEIQPGNALKEYLIEMKSQGYCIIGAEQTSSSSSLCGFEFPEKSLILLGHEKEGVPCDLLNLMDHCVEVPQYGLIRSLNVHVTASIFIWEYQKQHRR